MKTRWDIIKEYSRRTGITDPKVDNFIKQQENLPDWGYSFRDMFLWDKPSSTTIGVDYGYEDKKAAVEQAAYIFRREVLGTWPEWEFPQTYGVNPSYLGEVE